MKLQIFLSLFVPSLSGLTFLAYKHPKAYKKLFTPLYFISSASFGMLSTWDFGIWLSSIMIKQKFPELDAKLIESTLYQWTVPYWWLAGCYLFFCIFLLFLSNLHNLINEDK